MLDVQHARAATQQLQSARTDRAGGAIGAAMRSAVPALRPKRGLLSACRAVGASERVYTWLQLMTQFSTLKREAC